MAIYGRIATLELFRPTVSSLFPKAEPMPNAKALTTDCAWTKGSETSHKEALKLCGATGTYKGSFVPFHRAMQVLRAGVQLRHR